MIHRLRNFTEVANYSFDVRNFKKGSEEGFPLIMNLINKK